MPSARLRRKSSSVENASLGSGITAVYLFELSSGLSRWTRLSVSLLPGLARTVERPIQWTVQRTIDRSRRWTIQWPIERPVHRVLFTASPRPRVEAREDLLFQGAPLGDHPPRTRVPSNDAIDEVVPFALPGGVARFERRGALGVPLAPQQRLDELRPPPLLLPFVLALRLRQPLRFLRERLGLRLALAIDAVLLLLRVHAEPFHRAPRRSAGAFFLAGRLLVGEPRLGRVHRQREARRVARV